MQYDAAHAQETISADQSFQVHLRSLQEFARELEAQFEAARKPFDDVSSLNGAQLPLGEFSEAAALRERHRVAVNQMRDLIDAVRSAISFATDVTKTISESYEAYDDHIAGLYGGQHSSVDGRASLDAPQVTITVSQTDPASGLRETERISVVTPTGSNQTERI